MQRFAFALSIALASAFGQSGYYTPLDVPDSLNTIPWAINKSGDIVGEYLDKNNLYHGFKLSAGKFTTIDYPGATQTEPYGLNNRGDISGRYRNADNVYHGFLMTASGQFKTIDYPGATATQGWGVSPSGDVAGQYTASGVTHGFTYSQDHYTSIDPPGSTSTTVTAINALGDISMIASVGGSIHAFVLSDGEYMMIDVPGSNYTNTTSLPPHGGVLGRYTTAGGAANGYLFRDGVFNLIKYPGAVLTGPAGMNERGDIVGRYQNSDSVFHGFMVSGLVPTPVTSVPRVAITTNGMAVTHSSTFALVSEANPAAAGEVLSLFAIGMGPTKPPIEDGKPFPSAAPVAGDVEVRVNGKVAELLGAVGLPGTIGGYQVNFRVPSDAVKGVNQLQLGAGLAVDSSVRISIK